MQSLNALCLLLALGFAPLAWLVSILYRRRFKQVVLHWKKPQIVVFTILAFVANLVLFVLACFFAAGYMGRVDGVGIFELQAEYLKWLALDCLLLLAAVTFLFMAVQNFLTQFVTQKGIYLHNGLLAVPDDGVDLLRWEQIKDYYVQSDYPVTQYYFILAAENGTYARKMLRVPFYMLPRFEAVLEMSLKAQQEMRQSSRATLRKMSKN
jgi:hypothetical protein